MERNTQRINGELERLHRLSYDELDNHLTHAFHRLTDAQADVDRLLAERHRRINTALPFGELAVHASEILEVDPTTFNDGFATDSE